MSTPTMRSTRNSGFTLIETLVVLAVVGLVAAALAVTVTTFLRTEGSVSARITESADLQNVTNFFPRDIASARTLDEGPPTPAANACGTGGTILLHMQWAETWLGVTDSTRVTYREFVTGSNRRLTRFECRNANPVTEFTVADVYQSVNILAVKEPPITGPKTGTVQLSLTFPDGNVRSVTATSRNFLP